MSTEGAEATPTLEEIAERLAALEERVEQLGGDDEAAQVVSDETDSEPVSISAGVYLVGSDIPAGLYSFQFDPEEWYIAVFSTLPTLHSVEEEGAYLDCSKWGGGTFDFGLSKGLYVMAICNSESSGGDTTSTVTCSVRPYVKQTTDQSA